MTEKLRYNDDPEWVALVLSYDSKIKAIASKATTDHGLWEDCVQEAYIDLLTVIPSRVRQYWDYRNGSVRAKTWVGVLDRYCRNVIRNSVRSHLSSYRTGSWRTGRTVKVYDKAKGMNVKRRQLSRMTSLDELSEDYGLQVDEHFNLSWPKVRNPSDFIDVENGRIDD